MVLGGIEPFGINTKLLRNIERLMRHITGDGRQERVVHLSILHTLNAEAGTVVCVDGVMGDHQAGGAGCSQYLDESRNKRGPLDGVSGASGLIDEDKQVLFRASGRALQFSVPPSFRPCLSP